MAKVVAAVWEELDELHQDGLKKRMNSSYSKKLVRQGIE